MTASAGINQNFCKNMFSKIETFYQKIKSHKLLSAIIHILMVAGFLYLWLPVARFFYNSFPPLGNDYYQFTSYLHSLTESFRLPPLSWRGAWFMGQPLIFDHPWLHVYAAFPLVKILGLINGANFYSLFTLFLFFFFTYLAAYQISKNKLLAGLLTGGLVWVNSIYAALYSGGNTSFSSTLFFLPLLVFLIIKYYQSGQRLYFYLACLGQGLAFLGHPGTALFFILLPTASVLFFYSDDKVKFFSWRKFKDLFVYIISAALIGGPLLFALIKLYLELVSFGKETGEGKQVADTFTLMVRFLNPWIFLPLVASLIGAIFSQRFWFKVKMFFPFLLTFIYIFSLEWLYYIGKNPLRGNILPTRTYWLISLTAVFGIAIFWTSIFKVNKNQSNNLGKISKIIIIIVQIIIIGSLGYLSYPQKNTEEMLAPTIGENISIRPFADAYPKDFVHEAVVNGVEGKYNEYFPSWLDKNSNDYRIHSLIPGFNVWWNLIYSSTLTHGYYDSRSRQEQDWGYWLDTALAGELTYKYNHPYEVAKNSALWLIDWYAVKYLEGREVDYSTGKPNKPPLDTVVLGNLTSLSSYLLEDPKIVEESQVFSDPAYLEKKLGGKIPLSSGEFMQHVDRLLSYGLATDQDLVSSRNVKPMTDEEVRAQLKKEGWADFWVNMDFLAPTAYPAPVSFVSINNDYVSPITDYSNAPVLYLTSQNDGYNNFIRVLGHSNYNSQYLVPIRGDSNINKISQKELSRFDAVMLYLYDSVSKGSWNKLKKYVENGGRLFIDTGSDQAESTNANLPDIFPVSSTRRNSLGSEWKVTQKADIFEGINFDKFDKLKYEEADWNLSSATNLRNGAEALLSQDGRIVLAVQEVGRGRVVWSGMNLPFRINYYHNAEEVKFFEAVMNKFLTMKKQVPSGSTLTKKNPEHLLIKGQPANGVIVKENFDKGWAASYKSGGQSGKLKIYPAGPDLMYVRLPDGLKGEVSVNFIFRGSALSWFLYLLSLLTIISLILLSIFGHKLFKLPTRKLKSTRLTKKISSWWEKDEEE